MGRSFFCSATDKGQGSLPQLPQSRIIEFVVCQAYISVS